jgi:hypothetical protein
LLTREPKLDGLHLGPRADQAERVLGVKGSACGS